MFWQLEKAGASRTKQSQFSATIEYSQFAQKTSAWTRRPVAHMSIVSTALNKNATKKFAALLELSDVFSAKLSQNCMQDVCIERIVQLPPVRN